MKFATKPMRYNPAHVGHVAASSSTKIKNQFRQSYREFKGGNFFETQCSYVKLWPNLNRNNAFRYDDDIKERYKLSLF